MKGRLSTLIWFLLVGADGDRGAPFLVSAFTDNQIIVREAIVASAAVAQALEVSDDSTKTGRNKVPFIIERIGRGDDDQIEKIAAMCVDVFFNPSKNLEAGRQLSASKNTPAWRSLQLAYLRSAQIGDMRSRRAFKKDSKVELIIARRIDQKPPAELEEHCEVMGTNTTGIYNSEQLLLGESGDLVKGPIIGFCEVSERKFGLGKGYNDTKARPYISNLSVIESARESGIGSRLVDACEEAVLDWDAGHKEIALQVEEDNKSAIQFYKKRGYEYVFSDPTCKRYDASGFFLKESKVTKFAMTKRLPNQSRTGGEVIDPPSFVDRLRNSFFVQKTN
ncbi:hypothetical protein THAOC_14868 [Thalassiosira oceanica]|uniref:N-acetyltransferase domain-containing protein n=1 Tax=Thalassiosira oceanica TaxID=159749 RepID=K0SE37_THAOC|nr:hypothetical protein THAOC_14868 [Thalassiosira oceanica]|mmetsp:Transcript_21638/g.50904  ORF Transcript_21638/g.50904 Transcript_21638/m.50904 type:complete len:335 (+) Transcript_21638:211-1215(+)|eukprot:EJK64398.1 hypothetical protein THAOC_14868 [Thalassiosira oceanica]